MKDVEGRLAASGGDPDVDDVVRPNRNWIWCLEFFRVEHDGRVQDPAIPESDDYPLVPHPALRLGKQVIGPSAGKLDTRHHESGSVRPRVTVLEGEPLTKITSTPPPGCPYAGSTMPSWMIVPARGRMTNSYFAGSGLGSA